MGVRSLRSSLTLSVVFHALFAAFLLFLLRNPAQIASSKRLTWVEFEPPRPQTQAKKSNEIQQKRADASVTHQQIVQTQKGHLTEKPPVDAFLGEKNQTVDRQTVSRDHNTVMGKSQSDKKLAHQAPQPVPQDLFDPATKPLAKLGVPILPTLRPQNKALENLAAEDTPDWAGEGNQAPQDYVRGLAQSDRTALNTREFAFYGYYQRIRERLDRAWVPILRDRLSRYYRSGRRLASDMDYSTRVKVVLNQGGEIVRVQILSESGAHDLDDAAVKAFNRAGPFPNPPRGIVGVNGEIEIPWEFVLRT